MFEHGQRVTLTAEAMMNRTEEMQHVRGTVILYCPQCTGKFPTPNPDWIAVLWDRRERIWTEHVENLVVMS